MLVLTRKLGQSIMIGDRVEVQVLSVAGEKVRLGITAPEDVSIFRNEVYDRIESETEVGPEDEGTDNAVSRALQRLSVSARRSGFAIRSRPQAAARPSNKRVALSRASDIGLRPSLRKRAAWWPLAHQPGQRLEHRHDHGDDRDRQADQEDAEPDLAA